jgi:LacI family transcriptional regulator
MGASFYKKHRTTIVDIAKTVGVSVSTVSRALKDHQDISLETRELVKQVAINMDYQPNLVAKSLNSRETHTIGVIVPNLENPFFSFVLSGIQHAASISGYKVMICQSNESHKTEVANLQIMMNNWVDGLLICHSKETCTFDHLKIQMTKGIPIIHFDRICEEVPTSKVLLDNVNGAQQVVAHLIEQGCRKIAVIAGPAHLHISRKRLEGYYAVLEKNNIPVRKDYIAYTDFSLRSICSAIDKWMAVEDGDRPNAIFCISENSAITTIMYLKRKNIRIPEEVCVAGFGNTYSGQIIEPALTTYDPLPFKIGETAVELFFDQIISGENYAPQIKTIEGKLIVRASTMLC